MITYDIIKSLLEERGETNFDILRISITGSAIFKGLENIDHDLDIRVICDTLSKDFIKLYYKDENYQYDIMVYTITLYKDNLEFKHEHAMILYNYFHYLDFILFNKVEINWDIFDYEKEYMSFLKNKLLKSSLFNTEKPIKWVGEKNFVHYYVILKFFENHSIELTEEIKRDVLKMYNKNGRAQLNWIAQKFNLTFNWEIKL